MIILILVGVAANLFIGILVYAWLSFKRPILKTWLDAAYHALEPMPLYRLAFIAGFFMGWPYHLWLYIRARSKKEVLK
jgi:formate/nitrite transporter FocA (FNT family)